MQPIDMNEGRVILVIQDKPGAFICIRKFNNWMRLHLEPMSYGFDLDIGPLTLCVSHFPDEL